MKIAVVGTGYVGLVTGTCFAETGNDVTCVDIDRNKVEKLSNGQITIYEPGLEKLFLRNLKEERLRFTTSLEEGIKDATIIFLALPTPPGEDGSADLKYILGVSDHLGKILTEYKVIIDKSTVPVGTAEKVHAAIAANYKGEFDVVSNPEFLREGVAVDDFMKPDRVVVGTTSERAKKVMGDLYNPFVRQGNPIIFMDERSAELTKYAANSFLAAKITFMNEIAQLCERLDADVDMVRRGIGSDERIGKRFLFPGIGYGGSFGNAVNRRGRDYTPVQHSDEPSSGGADAFLKFISGTLWPELAKRYPIDPTRRGIAGHSLGSLFVLHALFQTQPFFTNFLASAPSIWWADRAILRQAAVLRERQSTLPGHLFLSVGENDSHSMTGDLALLEHQLEAKPFEQLQIITRRFPRKNHFNVLGPAFQTGMETLFPDNINRHHQSGNVAGRITLEP